MTARVSLHRSISEITLSPKQLFEFVNNESAGVITFFINLQSVKRKNSIPLVQVSNFSTLKGTPKSHELLPGGENIVMNCVCRCSQKFSYLTQRKSFIHWAHHMWIILCLFSWWVVLWCCKLCFGRKLRCEH